MRSFFFSSRRRHTRSYGDWSSDVCSSDLPGGDESARSGRLEQQPVREEEARLGGVHHLPRLQVPPRREIGRASCRERVYVSVVGAALTDTMLWWMVLQRRLATVGLVADCQ